MLSRKDFSTGWLYKCKVFSALSAKMVMSLAVFSALRDEHSQDTLLVSRWETESAVGLEYEPDSSPAPVSLLLE